MQVLAIVVLFASLWNGGDTAASDLAAVRKSNWEFTKSMYSMLDQQSPSSSSNILFSPLSVQLVLAMCYVGAEGETATQVSKALHLPDSQDVIESGFHQLLESFPTSVNVTLDIANVIFASKTYPVLGTFKNTAIKTFSSNIENVNFKDASKTAGMVNKWVKEKTHGKIEDIVNGKTMSATTLMILVNAVYFLGTWQYPFNKESTMKAIFHVGGKVEKEVDMMRIIKWFPFVEHKAIGARLLKLPYADKSTSLVIVLPLELDGLANVEAKLANEDLKKILESTTTNKPVDLSLPRFGLELLSNLDGVLKGMGIVDMFESTANFSRVSTTKGLYVSSVQHKAMIEVNEEGTVAAGTTKAGIESRDLAAPPPVKFVVDRPFMFALVSERAGVVLFAGRNTGAQSGSANTIVKSGGVKQVGENRSSSLIAGWLVLITLLPLSVGAIHHLVFKVDP